VGQHQLTAVADYEGEHRRLAGPAVPTPSPPFAGAPSSSPTSRSASSSRASTSSPRPVSSTARPARENAGLPRGTGPWRVVTPWSVFDYDDNRRLRLTAVSPFVTVDQVLAEMSFEPAMAPEIGVVETPTEEELLVLRTELDTRGQITDVGWIELRDDGRYVFAEGGGGGDTSLPRSW
jgi:hypothetical protein